MAYSEEELIEELERVSEEHCDGEAPTKKDMDKHGKFSYSPYYRRFGGWNEALEESGFKINKYQNITEEDLINDLKRLKKQYCNNGNLTTKDIKKYSKFSWDVYYDKWGSIEEVSNQINMNPKREMNYSENEIIKEVYRISEQYCKNNAPTLNDMQKYSKYSSGLIKKVFDCTWSEKLEEIGLQPNSSRHLSDEDLLKHIKDNSKNGIPPKYREMQKKDELISPVVFQKRFGSWNNAVEQAGLKSRKPAYLLSGEESYVWKDGNNYKYYGKTWSNNREKAYDRDNGVCRICKDNNKIIDVHHINPVRNWNVEEEHEEMNSLSNLVCLCRSCHNEFEGMFQDEAVDGFVRKAREYLDIGQGTEDQVKESIFDY